MDINLTYRLPTLADQDALRAYVEEHYKNGEPGISASMNLTSMNYESWLNQVNRNIEIPNGDWGRSYTLLCLNEKELVGLLSIRYELSEELRQKYGDIGYGVRPKERRKGYAAIMLRHALYICKEKGMEQVELGCFRDNTASIRTIKNNGGQLLRECEDFKEGTISQYYSIKL